MNRAVVAVFIIFALLHKLGLEVREGVGIIRSIQYRFLVHAPPRYN